MKQPRPEELEGFIEKFNKAFEGLDPKWVSIEGFYQELLEIKDRDEFQELAFQTLEWNRDACHEIEKVYEESFRDCAPRYFDWDSRPIKKWEYHVKSIYFSKHVGLDIINGWRISTVWMGLNHAFFREHPPLIFETMIFTEEGTSENDFCSHYQERYTHYQEALEGHPKACEAVRHLDLILESQNDN